MTYSPSGIKSLQRGTILIASGAGAANNTATITAVVLAKSEIRLGGSTPNADADSLHKAAVELTNTTTVTAYRRTATDPDVMKVWYEVTEHY